MTRPVAMIQVQASIYRDTSTTLHTWMEQGCLVVCMRGIRKDYSRTKRTMTLNSKLNHIRMSGYMQSKAIQNAKSTLHMTWYAY